MIAYARVTRAVKAAAQPRKRSPGDIFLLQQEERRQRRKASRAKAAARRERKSA
jgi:hypothetical protein